MRGFFPISAACVKCPSPPDRSPSLDLRFREKRLPGEPLLRRQAQTLKSPPNSAFYEFSLRAAFSGERGLKKEATQYAKDRPKWTCVVAGNVGTVVPLGEKLRALGRNAVIIADTRPGETYVVNIGPPFFPLEQIAKGIEGSAHRDVVQADFQEPRKRESLRIFLCHSSSDKPAIRALDGRLRNDGFHPWLDEVDLLPGQDWEHEISAAVRNSGVVLVCLSRASTTREGFVQKEIKYALDVADEKPEGTIFIIPVRLEECVVPARLGRWHWVNLFEDNGYNRLLAALRSRHQSTAGQG